MVVVDAGGNVGGGCGDGVVVMVVTVAMLIAVVMVMVTVVIVTVVIVTVMVTIMMVIVVVMMAMNQREILVLACMVQSISLIRLWPQVLSRPSFELNTQYQYPLSEKTQTSSQ